MSDGQPKVELQASAVPSLRSQASQQIIDLLRLGEASTNPAISAAAIRHADAERKHLHKQETRVSPRGAWLWCLVIWSAGVAGCWYSILTYTTGHATATCAVVFLGCSIATLICLTLARVVSAADLLEFLRSIRDKLFAVWDKWTSQADT